MAGGPPFIKFDVFKNILGEIRRSDGEPYQDVDTIYGDLSRLVVVWLARQSVEEIEDLYNELGWKGTANSRALNEAARRWIEKYHGNGS